MDSLIPLAGIGMVLLICVAFFATIAAIFVMPAHFKSKERRQLADTMRAAIERGEHISPEVIEALKNGIESPRTRTKDIRTAIIWLAIAGAFVIWGVLAGLNDGDMREGFSQFGFAALPGLVGLAYLGFGLTNKDR